jgi:hypothetical protein
VVIVPAAMIVQTVKRLPTVRAAEADLDAKVKAGLDVSPFIQNLIYSAGLPRSANALLPSLTTGRTRIRPSD